MKSILTCVAMLAATTAIANAKDAPMQAGFERITTDKGVEIGIWYPASGTPKRQPFGLYAEDVVAGAPLPGGQHPLVVISHGTGGQYAGHVDTAVALAKAGFVVAALTHPGDNYQDQSKAVQIWGRPPALSAMIDYVLSDWRGRAAIDPKRIGAFGFSAGGFTVLAAAGGRPDLARIVSHCRAHPTYFDCQLVKDTPRTVTVTWPEMKDGRIKALVVAAPALGYMFDKAGLSQVTQPVQLWRADKDSVLPAPEYADAVRAALSKKPDFQSEPGADHFDFLAPCAKPDMVARICQTKDGFDRVAFHVRFNQSVTAFFRKHLRVK